MQIGSKYGILNIAIYAEIHFEGSDMNKTEFVAAVAEAAGASKKDAENIINATLAQIEKTLVAGEAITVPASKAPAFKAGKALKDAVNK